MYTYHMVNNINKAGVYQSCNYFPRYWNSINMTSTIDVIRQEFCEILKIQLSISVLLMIILTPSEI